MTKPNRQPSRPRRAAARGPTRRVRTRWIAWALAASSAVAVFALGWLAGRQTPPAVPVGMPATTATLASDPPGEPAFGEAAILAEVVELTNRERLGAGCDDLVANQLLQDAARGHSLAMAEQDFFDHVQPDGTTLKQRIEAVGYLYGSIGENIAAGQSSPTEVVAAWMRSEGHRKNILNCDFTEIGIGYAFVEADPGEITLRHYWTQNFGAPRGR